MKKKYLFICGELNAGGGERVLVDLLRNFDYTHYDVDLLQINGGGILRDQLPSNVSIYEAWYGYPISYKLISRIQHFGGINVFYRNKLIKAIHYKRYDVAISFLEGTPLLAHSLITDVANRNYSWVHVDLDASRYEAPLFRKGEELNAYNKLDAVICVAKDTAHAFHRRFNNCTTEVKVIYNAIDISRLNYLAKQESVESSCFTIAVCGRLAEQKKLERVIRLAQRLKEDEKVFHFLIIGDGDLYDALNNLANDLSVQDVLSLVGYKKNPYPYIISSDMLLSTSGWEGFSLVICEAMALGVPVVATKTAGPMEILDNDKFGLLCEHDDESIYQAVKRMYEDLELRKYYSEVGKERVKDFSVERAMNSIYQL